MIYLQRSFELPINFPSFDGTRHRAMSLRGGLNGGLPIGMMLVAKRFDESFVYRQTRARTGDGHERSARLHRGHAEVRAACAHRGHARAGDEIRACEGEWCNL